MRLMHAQFDLNIFLSDFYLLTDELTIISASPEK